MSIGRIVLVEAGPKPDGFGPYDSVDFRIEPRLAAENFHAKHRLLQFAIPAFEVALDNKAQEVRQPLVPGEAAAREHAIQLPPHGIVREFFGLHARRICPFRRASTWIQPSFNLLELVLPRARRGWLKPRMFSRIAVGLIGAAVAMSGCGIVGPSTESLLRGQTFDRIGRAIGGITVEVLDGLGAGTARRTDAQGHFELSSSDFVAGASVTLRFSGNGVLTRTASAQWDSVSSLKGYYPRFWLDTIDPPIGLEPGAYTLSVALDLSAATSVGQESCSGFPEELASRTYQTSISISPSPNPYKFDRLVNTEQPTLHGIDTWAPGGTSRSLFSLAVVGPFVAFDMDEQGILEEFPGLRYLDIVGISSTTEPATVSGSSISVRMNASFSYCELTAPLGTDGYCTAVPRDRVKTRSVCRSDRATMVFTKR